MRRLGAPFALLLVACFLLPVLGGQHELGRQAITGGFGAIVRAALDSSDAVALTQAILGLLFVVPLGIVVWQRRVIPTPSVRIACALLLLLGLLGSSILVSHFKFASTQAWVTWLVYGAAFFATVAVGGRVRGPRLILWAMTAGGGFVGIKGVLEYFTQPDPSWRIFGGWVNPNALAGMLILLIPIGLALMITESERKAQIGAGLATAMMLFALVLTQSKGGYLALAIALAVLVALVLAWGGVKRALAIGVPLVLAVAFAAALPSLKTAPDSSVTALQRLGAASETQEQSAGFRKLLWESAVKLVQSNPKGSGVGTFRYVSTKPGLVNSTQLAHQSYLQLAVEASLLAPLLILAIGVFWLFECLRGARTMPTDRNLLRAGVVSAIVASAAHSFIDSDLYYFGIGVLFFSLLGVGLQLAVDGTGPEFVPRRIRQGSVLVCCGLLTVGLLYFAIVGVLKAQVRGDIAVRRFEALQPGLESLHDLAGWDGDTQYLWAMYTMGNRTPEKRAAALKRAAELAPANVHFRSLAKVQLDLEQTAEAIESLNAVLRNDPNNLPAHRGRIEIYLQTQQPELAREAAQRAIAVESSPAFKVRALPELIPTETYFARRVLAEMTSEPGARIELLEPALAGYTEYRNVTVPRILRVTEIDPSVTFANESRADARGKMEEAVAVATLLATAYDATGQPDKAADARRRGADFGSAVP
ncbi:MAG TPA: O-antigen ligase family protein [Fimbriimonadaceae bacterium]|mgnify:CR=1 FL=1|nr:O-antigen ligase family protein [Fimbriimonadaceae bacterium]